MLGKRKRDTQASSRARKATEGSAVKSEAQLDMNAVFRKHFEASFAPLPEESVDEDVSDNDVDDDDIDDADPDSDGRVGSHSDTEVSEWSGLSEAETTSSGHIPVVEIVDYAISQTEEQDEFLRRRQKAFMSTRVPREIDITHGDSSTSKSKKEPGEDDPAKKLNLKHDLDLQRLLRESHLLEKSKASSAPGKQRQQALELRLQALGAKESVLAQQKMPLSHRKGILRKAESKDTRRRREAKENGVILEKAQGKSKNVRRDRGVDTPGVGRFMGGGTLKLSKKDIASITGPPGGGGGGGKTKGRKR